MSTCRYSRTRRCIKQRDERAEELAQILLHTTRDLTQRNPIPKWYQYVCEQNEGAYVGFIDAVVNNRYGFLGGLQRARTPRKYAQACKYAVRSMSRRVFRRDSPLLLIEPLGLLSAEWFFHRYGMKMLVLIRHPASFVSSIKRLGWNFKFADLRDQPLLMQRYLSRFENDLNQRPADEDIVGQGILAWRILYSVVSQYSATHADWDFVRQEDLALDPLVQFEALYRRLGLSYTRRAEHVIRRATDPSNPVDVPISEHHQIARDSRQTATIWRRRLVQDEIDRIRAAVEDVSHEWYADEDWL